MTSTDDLGLNDNFDEGSLWRKLWYWISPDKKYFILLNLVIIINVVVAIIGPYYLQKTISLFEENDNFGPFKREALKNTLIYSISVLLLFIIQVVQKILIVNLNSRVIDRIRAEAFSKVLQNNVSFFDKSESAKLLSRLINDTNELLDSGSRFAHAFSQFFVLLGVFSIMVYLDPILALAAISVTPLLFISAILIRKAQRRISKRWRAKISSVNNRFGEVIGAISITKSFGREEDNLSQFHELNEETYDAAKKRGMVIFAMGPFGDFIRTLGVVVLLFVGVYQINNGTSVATVYFFILLQTFLFDPVAMIARAYSQFQSSFAALERIMAIMADKITTEAIGGDKLADKLIGKIEFSNLTFQYEPNEPVIQNVSFEINPGETIAIVGHTGAGKTTIASLLMGYYRANTGQILFDDNPIDDYNLFSLRKNIGYVSQDVLLFAGTIKENLLLVNPKASEADITKAIQTAQAKEFMETLPHGIDTLILEGGKNLSKGQMQMVSLARALLIDPKILILDEFTSSLDLYTESKIQLGIKEMLQGRTSIVIAHRLTTILNADRILVLENGNLVEQGTHHQLMSNGGIYASIYEKYFSFQLAELKPLIKK